ncbi:aquaporin-like protein [Powellomyces hirtus]|nr:aquaporin-like protein [Powellomyces hirtus]
MSTRLSTENAVPPHSNTLAANRQPSFKKVVTSAKSAAHFMAKDISGGPTPRMRIARAMCAELIGTMLFVFAVAGSACIPAALGETKGAGLLITALTQGLAIAALVSATGPISGGHLNPAVTTSLMVVRAISFWTGISYIVSQCVGAITGAALFKLAIGSALSGTLGATVPIDTAGRTFTMEFMITTILVFTVLGTAVHGGANGVIKALAPIPIGFAVLIGVLIGGSITGGSMNPARSLGPAVVAGMWTEHYLYWAAPLGAAIVTGTLYKAVFLSSPITLRQARVAGILPGPTNNVGRNPDGIHASHATVLEMGNPGMSEADLIHAEAIDPNPIREADLYETPAVGSSPPDHVVVDMAEIPVVRPIPIRPPAPAPTPMTEITEERTSATATPPPFSDYKSRERKPSQGGDTRHISVNTQERTSATATPPPFSDYKAHEREPSQGVDTRHISVRVSRAQIEWAALNAQ